MEIKSLIHPRQLEEVVRLIRTTPKEGIIVEVGVYQGGSAVEFMKVAKERNQELWLFDTFSGMPEASEIDWHKIGEFDQCSEDAVRSLLPEAHIFAGFFPDTWNAIPEKKKISFAHVDCDQYLSIANCITIFKPMMLPGGIMWFDDYGHAHLPGAQKAVDEFLPERLIHPLGRAYYIF